MWSLYFMECLILYFSLVESVTSVNFYKSSQGKQAYNPKDVILSDMLMAFSPVMATKNKTNNMETVISHMYNFQYQKKQNTKSAMIFKLPFGVNSPNQQHQVPEKMVLMERQHFMQPTFPNLTESYMTLRRFKFSNEPISFNISKLIANEMHNLDRDGFDDDDWSHLGLSGWNGAIAGSSARPDQINGNKLQGSSTSDYPLIEITKDLTNGTPKSDYFQQIAANNLREKTDRVAMMKELDHNVFIARANDPFGYSTKWQMKSSNKTISKRDVLRLYSMIKCSTGCEPLGYKGYGCYCGFLGHGVATDGIDRCCKLHDKCYGNSNCISYLEYFVPYVWKCYRGKPLCAIDHGEWGGPDSCAARLCYCDLRLSRCLRQYACPEKRAVCRSSVARRLQNILLVR